MATQIWIPEAAREQRLTCLLCGTQYPKRQESRYHRHLKRCVSKNWQEIASATEFMQDPEAPGAAFRTHLDPERYRFEKAKATREKRRDVKGAT